MKAQLKNMVLEWEGVTFQNEVVQSSGAILSPDALYRYVLWRQWANLTTGTVAFIGLNPSTADATQDDPTIRRCIGFAKRWGFGRMVMLNLFAARSTDPAGLDSFADPVGPDNEMHVARELDSAARVIAAWGSSAPRRSSSPVGSLLEKKAVGALCLGTNKDGCPKHPLHVPYSTQLKRWPE